MLISVGVSDIFYFFSARGRGRGSLGRQGGGCWFFHWKSQEGGSLRRGGRGCLRGISGAGGGGLNIFFSEPKFPPSNSSLLAFIGLLSAFAMLAGPLLIVGLLSEQLLAALSCETRKLRGEFGNGLSVARSSRGDCKAKMVCRTLKST